MAETIELNARWHASGSSWMRSGIANDINVVEAGKDRFAFTQLRVNSCDSRVLSDSVEGAAL